MAETVLSESSPHRLPFYKMYQFSTALDYFFIFAGTLSAIGMGIIQPMLFYFVGNIYTSISPNSVKEDFYTKAIDVDYLLIALGTAYLICAYLAVVFWVNVGCRQSNHFREQYMKAVLRQDPAWYDKRAVAELPNALTSDTTKIERATGDKLVMLIFTSVMVLSAMGISIAEGLQLTLVALAFAPLMIGGLVLANNTLERNARMDDTSYKEAGGIAEEALTEIKTVAAHNAQTVESFKYVGSLKTSYRAMLGNGLKIGAGLGVATASFLGMLSAVVVTSGTLVRDKDNNWVSGDTIDLGRTMIVMFVCMMAFNSVGTLAPCLKIIIEGTVAAASVMQVIHTDNSIKTGTHIGNLQGVVEFKDVDFAYPSTPQKPILKKMSFSIHPGDTLAILGETGSGKSTVVSLLMRFYDRTGGMITVDGVDIHDWDLASLRSQIGLVSQEPILFNATIKENIKFGLNTVTQEEIEDAAKEAEVLNFINELTDRFETKVGSKGSQLSGGERQRIAIARAIIRKPKLLLLDESTSALDKNTEAAVQHTLNTLMSTCTTIMIAHRISTIRKATKVLVINEGEVAEMGTQEELKAKEGRFYHQLKMQNIELKEDYNESEPISAGTTATRQKAAPSEALAPTEDKEEQEKPQNYGKRLMQMTSGNCHWVVLGAVGSILAGVAFPFQGMILGLELQTLGQDTGYELESNSRFYGGMLGVLAFGVLLGMIFQASSFPLVSARATRTMRQESFKALLSYDLAFFDMNSPTVLATQLSSDCEKVNGLGGNVVALLLGVICSLVASFVISGIYCWQIMLVIMAIFPIYVASVLASFLAQAQGLISYTYEDATIFASDCILNYKTVKAFGMEEHLLQKYMEVVEKVSSAGKKRAHCAGFTFGLGYAMLFYLYAFLFWFAAKMFKDDIVAFDGMNVALFAGLSGTSSIFMSGVFAPDIKQGQTAAKNLFKILDYEPKIDPNSDEGDKSTITGEIQFSEVSFVYPNRDMRVLSNITFTIPAGSTFAIVGTTGSGKSTVIQLLLRFYDTSDGSVLFDKKDVKDLNIRHLRSQLAIVSQEPVLFTGSISSNIAYGIEASPEEITQAATQAQALSFIEHHPDGFNREVGLRGTRLSGGEKQRVAIARAIIRKPKILILDEATSALDSDTEAKLVDVLKGVMVGRTCVVVAHRIKTISNMDQIAVLSNGSLIELGSFSELMEKKGFLYSLAKQQ